MTAMEKRAYGNTGERLSMVGFGGIVVMDEEPSSSERLVGQAVDRGINYFDVAPAYGNAEERLGPALGPYRPSVFLACKTSDRTKEGAARELRRSLGRLRTDHVDLYQFHGVRTLEDVDRITGPGGALEAFVEAREQGLVRYVGFSAHSEEAALVMLDRFGFDSILFPFNWASWHRGGFGPRVLEKAREKGTARLALKALARRKWNEGEEQKWSKCWYAPAETPDEASLALRFTLSKPITSAIGPGHAELLWWAADAADRFEPLGEDEAAHLADQSEGLNPIFGRNGA
jgi:aryl-alcohol dehydrogenase-like predicted oxidoreductase